MHQADTSDHVDEELLNEVLMLLDDEAPDGLLRACDLFRSAIPQRMGDIEAALGAGRFDDAARASHSLRGSAGAFGARRLSSLGEQLESLCVHGDGVPAASLIAEMRDEFELFRVILDARLAEATAGRRAGD
jgi:HPt (histidine-containing phosphotransfer) domain-containing protein